MNYLNEQRKSSVLQNEWLQIEEFYNKKLWHQLTLKMLELVTRPELQQGQALISLYENFISDFEHRINPLSLVEMCLPIVRQYKDSKLAIEFLEKLKEKVKHEPPARILCSTSIGAINLEQKQFDLVKKIIEDTEQEVNDLDGITSIHSRYYELASNYYRIVGNHSDYYRNALRFLGCRDFNAMSLEAKQEDAFYLGLAAILGDGIYNFGELLMHPILNSLQNTQNKWLVDLLFAFNSGDIDKFDALKPSWSSQADLKAAEVKMRQKICLMCLMEISFQRPSSNRQLTFDEVAMKTKLPVNEVELLVMRALSLELIKGYIDEIDRKIHVSWVKPRVLDINQIKMMRTRLDLWANDVNSVILHIQDTAHEILT